VQIIDITQFALYLAIYSFLGWLCECVWCLVLDRRIVNRGFLSGPWCPIYGFGAILILKLASPFSHNPALVYIISVAAASILEYYTGWLMETLFRSRWWDYSHMRFNLKGRVCLLNASIFGVLGLVIVFFVHRRAALLVDLLGPGRQRVLAGIFLTLLLADFTRSLSQAAGLRERMENLRDVFEELARYNREYAWFDKSDPSGSITRLREICAGENTCEPLLGALGRIDELARRFGEAQRMHEAFPRMRSAAFAAELETLRKEWAVLKAARRENCRRARRRLETLRKKAESFFNRAGDE